METFLANKDAYPVLGVLVVGLSVALPIIAHYWYRARRAEMELSLKQAMVERGMSADEICAVIEAGEVARPDPMLEGRSVRYKRVRL
jgi:hypothetical protein